MAEETVEQPGTQPPPAAAAQTGDETSGELQKESIWEVYFPTKLNIDKRAIPVASFPMIIYFWPTIVAMLGCGICSRFGWVEANTLGWVATVLLSFNLMVIVTDLDQKKFIIVMLLVILVGMGLWVSNLKELGFVSGLLDWLQGLDVTYSTHTYFILFSVLWFFFALGMLHPRFNYWRLEPNEFVHYIQPWGRDQSVPRLGSTVTREVPDVLELLLTFGGGTLVIRREGQVVARIEHVPFLGRRMVAIERMLGVTRVRHVDG